MYCGETGDDIYLNVPGYTESIHIAPYNCPLPPSIFSVLETHPHSKTKPFRQRIQLRGPSQYPVRATAQVDDGAMRNCIGLHIWIAYGHCLGELTPTALRVSVANNKIIQCAGLWSGEVNIGGTISYTHFVVFDCDGAFDVILGKPWLNEVNAMHNYRTDTIVINTESEPRITIGNAELQTTNNTPEPMPTLTITTEELLPQPAPSGKPLDELIEDEMRRINTLGPFAETQWAKYLNVEDTDDEDPTPVEPNRSAEWFTTKAEQREIVRAQRRERKEDQLKRNREVVDWLTQEADKNKETERYSPTEHTLPKAEQRREKDLQDVERWRTHRTMVALIKSFNQTDSDPLELAEAQSLIDSERRIADLKSKLDYLRNMATTQTPENEDPNIHIANIVTEQEFTIDRGDNTSPRLTNPFTEEHVEEILQKIAIGPDLTTEQRNEVKALICDYADIFALSLSEVKVINWYKHHLNVDPTVKLPKKTAQRPVTEAQKDWFHSILDEMENAHVIQRVPGDFIKALSSTNLQPKEAGKVGAMRTEVLRKVNAECIKNGLPPFWEEVREPGESNEAMLEAVENQGGTEIKTKWRLCHAFTALNRATQVP